jgi:hypothetical protein
MRIARRRSPTLAVAGAAEAWLLGVRRQGGEALGEGRLQA